jgi:hypothetical protein
MEWVVFGIGVAVVVAAGLILWRRWRRWNPVQGTSQEARAAEARMWSTRQNEQTGGGF